MHILVPLALMLAGCATIEPQAITGPNGKPAYAMRCSGMGRTLEACYAKAGDMCPKGYTVVDRATGTVAVPVNGTIMAAPQSSLVIECK